MKHQPQSVMDCVTANDLRFSALFNQPHIVGPRIKPPPEKELVIERITICCEITCIADLLRIVNEHPVAENVEYNINMRALHRISEPLRKLDATAANLARLTDLTTELRRQLKPLGRQAEMARRAANCALF